jgi:hypothetical protein
MCRQTRTAAARDTGEEKDTALMNKRKWFTVLTSAIAGSALVASSVFAAVTFDPATGSGFVGKGDVHLVYGWNNKQLQDNAEDVEFRAKSEVVTEVSWICTNENNQNIQERERTTTTSIQGLVDSIARDKNQITGFILDGYSETPTPSSTTDGPAVNSCPSGPWSLTTPAGDPEEVSSTSTLEVSIDGKNWVKL